MQISQFYGHNEKMARTKIYTEQNKNTQNNNTAFRKNYFVVFFGNHSGNWLYVVYIFTKGHKQLLNGLIIISCLKSYRHLCQSIICFMNTIMLVIS